MARQNRLWRHPRTKQRIGSGAIHNGLVFVHNDPGIAECFGLQTGQLVWEQRLIGKGSRGTNWSSVMIADGLCYTMTQGGDCFVFRAGPQFELVAVNPLGEHSNSSLAASDGQLFLRTDKHLWCIGEKKQTDPKNGEPIDHSDEADACPGCLMDSSRPRPTRPGIPEDLPRRTGPENGRS